MNPVVHFEMPYEDKQRMADFYAKAFGWKAKMLGPDMGNYVMMATTEEDTKTRLPKVLGAINGGFFQKTKDIQSPSVVIEVENIGEAMRRVEAAGGKVLGGATGKESDDIHGVGLYASFLDTEGNRVSLIQPKQALGVRPE